MELIKILACGQLTGSHELFGTTLAVFWGSSLSARSIRLKIIGEETYRYVGFEYYHKVMTTSKDAIASSHERYFIDRDWALEVLGWLPEEAEILAMEPTLHDRPTRQHGDRKGPGSWLGRLLRSS